MVVGGQLLVGSIGIALQPVLASEGDSDGGLALGREMQHVGSCLPRAVLLLRQHHLRRLRLVGEAAVKKNAGVKRLYGDADGSDISRHFLDSDAGEARHLALHVQVQLLSHAVFQGHLCLCGQEILHGIALVQRNLAVSLCVVLVRQAETVQVFTAHGVNLISARSQQCRCALRSLGRGEHLYAGASLVEHINAAVLDVGQITVGTGGDAQL